MLSMSLAAARVNAGFSQREAAKRLNVTQKTLCSWEKARTFPKPEQIEKICELYGVTYEQINFFNPKTA